MAAPKLLKSAEETLSDIYDVVTNTDERRTRARKEAWEAVKQLLADIEPKAKEAAPVTDTEAVVTPAVDEPVSVPEAPAAPSATKA